MISNRKQTHAIWLLALVFVVACGSRGPEEPSPREDLVGVWDLVTVNGGALPTASPEERSIILESVVMTLESDGAYSLASSFHSNTRPGSQEITLRGTWLATDEVMRFETDQGPAIVEFGYAREGNTLRMLDEQLHEWVMRRRQ